MELDGPASLIISIARRDDANLKAECAESQNKPHHQVNTR